LAAGAAGGGIIGVCWVGGVVTESKTDLLLFFAESNVRVMQVTMKPTAIHLVTFTRKLEAPDAPNIL
jgi:hypothetical protein